MERPIRWVHNNVGVPNAADWLHGGELVLTTVYSICPIAPADRKTSLSVRLAAQRYRRVGYHNRRC